MTTKRMELEVLTFFAELFRAPEKGWWGYITNGSTECNLYALYAAREAFPTAPVYYSEAAHYSVAKNIHILGREGVRVAAQPHGEMDYDDLAHRLAVRADKPAVIAATVGTTMTEARDNIARIKTAAHTAGVDNYYIHVDGALAAPYAALTEPHHNFDFEDGADSISLSGHKFIGCPVPCGIVITRSEHAKRLAGQQNYTGSPDTTISGSRNGHTPLMLWYTLQKYGRQGLKERAIKGQELAGYAHTQLQQLGWESWRNPGALTVMLKTPSEHMVRKWQLATHNGWSHIICMPGVTKQKIDHFLQDLARYNTTTNT